MIRLSLSHAEPNQGSRQSQPTVLAGHACWCGRDPPEVPVKQLIVFLLDHAMLDFSGELTIEMVKDFLGGDDTPEARALLNKIMQDGGVEEMQVTLADCLQDALRTGLNEGVVGEQLKLYAES
jgi:hypothetical protein